MNASRKLPDDIRATCGDDLTLASVDVQSALADLEMLDDEGETMLAFAASVAVGVIGSVDSYSWRVVTETTERTQLIGIPDTAEHPGLDPSSYASATIADLQGQWTSDGVEQCRISLRADGYELVDIELDPSIAPDAAEATLRLHMRELNCANGEPPEDRMVVPVVTEQTTSVRVSVLVESPPAGASCATNQWLPLTVELSSPLGTRAILDGTTFPGAAMPWPPSAFGPPSTVYFD